MSSRTRRQSLSSASASDLSVTMSSADAAFLQQALAAFERESRDAEAMALEARAKLLRAQAARADAIDAMVRAYPTFHPDRVNYRLDGCTWVPLQS